MYNKNLIQIWENAKRITKIKEDPNGSKGKKPAPSLLEMLHKQAGIILPLLDKISLLKFGNHQLLAPAGTFKNFEKKFKLTITNNAIPSLLDQQGIFYHLNPESPKWLITDEISRNGGSTKFWSILRDKRLIIIDAKYHPHKNLNKPAHISLTPNVAAWSEIINEPLFLKTSGRDAQIQLLLNQMGIFLLKSYNDQLNRANDLYVRVQAMAENESAMPNRYVFANKYSMDMDFE